MYTGPPLKSMENLGQSTLMYILPVSIKLPHGVSVANLYHVSCALSPGVSVTNLSRMGTPDAPAPQCNSRRVIHVISTCLSPLCVPGKVYGISSTFTVLYTVIPGQM